MALAIKAVQKGSVHFQNVKQFLTCHPVGFLSTTCTNYFHSRWKRERKLPANPNACGPLTDKADYSYPDGKTVPIGSKMYNRLQKHRQYAERIVTLCKELDFALEWDKQLKLEEEIAKQQIIERKLKPKGYRLLKQ